MMEYQKTLWAIGSLMTIFLSPSPIVAVESSGVVTVVQGQVNKRLTTGKWHGLRQKSKVETGERVRTYEKSLAEISLHSSQKIRLGPDTTIDFTHVFEEGEKKVSELDLMDGDMWAEVDELEGDSSFQVNSSLAHATVRGTIFSLHADGDKSTLNVYRGSVAVVGQQAVGGGAGGWAWKQPGSDAGPREVAGPKEISMHAWLQVVKTMQQIVVSRDGSWQVRDIDPNEDFTARWMQWNKKIAP